MQLERFLKDSDTAGGRPFSACAGRRGNGLCSSSPPGYMYAFRKRLGRGHDQTPERKIALEVVVPAVFCHQIRPESSLLAFPVGAYACISDSMHDDTRLLNIHAHSTAAQKGIQLIITNTPRLLPNSTRGSSDGTEEKWHKQESLSSFADFAGHKPHTPKLLRSISCRPSLQMLRFAILLLKTRKENRELGFTKTRSSRESGCRTLKKKSNKQY